MDRIALARDAGAGEGEGHELLLGRVRLGKRLRSDEVGLALAAPAEAGLDRVAVLREVVAVEVEADLEAQGVARAQARGLGAAVARERVPHPGRAVRRDQQLDAVLARVAGARDEALDAGNGGLDYPHPLRLL